MCCICSCSTALTCRGLSLRRAVAEDVLDRALERSADESGDAREDKAATRQLLLQLAGSLLAEGDARPSRRTPRVLAAASHLVGAYALWYAKTADAPVEAALRYLLRAMGVPEVRSWVVLNVAIGFVAGRRAGNAAACRGRVS